MLLAAEGIANARIAAEVGTTTTSVWKWRGRYVEAGLGGLVDASRSGRPKQVDDERIITATLTPPPRKYGVTHSSSRLLGDHLKIGNATVARAWRKYGVQPWRSETFKFSPIPNSSGRPPTSSVPRRVHQREGLNAKIRQFITGWNDRKHAFVWTKTADEIPKKANRQTRH